jgi:hypothetical protein
MMMSAACCTCKSPQSSFDSGVSTGIVNLASAQVEGIKQVKVFSDSLVASNKIISTKIKAGHTDGKVDVDSISEASVEMDKTLAKLGVSLQGLESSATKMETMSSEIKSLEKKIADLQKTADILESENAKKLYEYIALFWVAGFVLIAGGIALSFFVHKMAGGMIAIVGAIVLGLASASQYYLREIAQVGFFMVVAGMVGGVAYLVYSAWKQKRTDVALSEVVELIEEMKKDLTEEQLQKMFGDNGVAMHLYGEVTMNMVEAKRNKIEGGGETK